MTGLTGQVFLTALRRLGLPAGDYAVHGSGVLFALGLRDAIGDLDVIARGDAWTTAVGLGTPTPAVSGHGQVVQLFGGLIEVFNTWPGDPPTDVLIDSAVVVDGVPFVRLAHVATWKTRTARPQDLTDLARIAAYLTTCDPAERNAS